MVIIGKKIIKFSMGGVEDLQEIPEGNWLVKWDSNMNEFYLEKVDDFRLPSKIYGDCELLSKRYLNTFNNTNKNLGIVLSGLKGTGKSLLAKKIGIDSKLPVILLSEDFCGTEFNSFIANIKQDAVVFIDEFEKMYDTKEKQDSLLSILDGVFMGKKIFLFTSNETSKYSNYLLNRPGRVHYMKEYERIEDSVLDEIVEDNLKNKADAKDLKDIINKIEEANIDMVFALIAECNMYNETPKEAVKYLNITVNGNTLYNIIVKDNDWTYSEPFWRGNPYELDSCSLYLDLNDEDSERYDKLKPKEKEKVSYSKSVKIDLKNSEIVQEGRILKIIQSNETIEFKPISKYKLAF